MTDGRTTLAREWSILLTACSLIPREEQIARLRALLSQPIDWRVLFEVSVRHGAQPLLRQALLGIDSMPAEEMRRLDQACQTNLHKALLLSRELIRIVDHLSALGIEVIPYKGPALAEALYGDIALRQSGDIDLLIRPQDLPRVRDAVRDLGYTSHVTLSAVEERSYLKSGYEYAFDGPGGPNLLEVQWGFVPRFYSVNFNVDSIFQRATIASVAGQPMKGLSHEDLFLVLAVHAAKHVWGRLIWLSDLARLMHSSDLNWDDIGVQARSLGIARIVRVTMILANRLLDANIPSAAQNAVSNDLDAEHLAREIQEIASEKDYSVESLAYFRLMIRLRERRADRVRFLKRLTFTSGPSEWKAVRLPAPLFPLYGVVRLSRLVKRFLASVNG